MRPTLYTAALACVAVALTSCAAFMQKDCPAAAPGLSADLVRVSKLLDSESQERDYARALAELRAALAKSKALAAETGLADAADVAALLETLKAANERADAAAKKASEVTVELRVIKERDAKAEEEMKLLRDQINKLQMLDIEMEKKRKNLR